MCLLLNLAPEVNARADTRRASLLEDGFTRGQEVRMVVLLRQAEAAGKIVRADEHGVQTGHGQDFVQGFDGGSALDVDDQQPVVRTVSDVGIKLRFEGIALRVGLGVVAP
jgi:hypothetical protein